ncbi:hypothetical protein QC760_008660 [Botrytis cinerea]
MAKLSPALLLAHAAMEFGLMIYLCFNWIMIALALRSQATQQFRGTDAGISRSETWVQNVRIREIANGRLQMIFEENGRDEDRWTPVKRVELDKKYGYEKGADKTYGTENIGHLK